MYVISTIINAYLSRRRFTGQKLHWNGSHKLDCKTLFDFILSDTCEKLSHDQMMDCQVLSQLVAEIELQRLGSVASIAIFESLLPSPQDLEIPPIIPMKKVDIPLLSRAPELYQRFPNNNHVIPIHLNGVGVAILPLTSRLLNHSCSPNAVLRYILSASQKPRAEVVAICEISEGEEVRLPPPHRNKLIRTVTSSGDGSVSRPRDLPPEATDPTQGNLWF